MRHRIYFHLTWTTRDRDPVIDAESETLLRRLLVAIARQERARILELGIVRTHVHVLLQLRPTTSIPHLVQRLKGGTSVIVNRERGTAARSPLRWAKGYNIDSVSPRAVARVRAYVRDQPIRHPGDAIRHVADDAAPGRSSRTMRKAAARDRTTGNPTALSDDG